VHNGVWSHYTFAMASKYRSLYKLIYVHDLNKNSFDHLDAIVIPFQSNHEAITAKQDLIYNFLAAGKKVFFEGDSNVSWLDAQWEERPVNNYWWVKYPNNPPESITNFDHPVYRGLIARHACWHTHGAYTRIPQGSEVIQSNAEAEIITWETSKYGGVLLAT